MTRPRVRDVLLVAVAAVITSGLSAFAATGPDATSEPTETPTEFASELTSEAPSELAPPADPTEPTTPEPVPPEATQPTKPAKPPKANRAPEAHKGSEDHGRKAGATTAKKAKTRGNGHGKAVSSAARGETPPVGNCRNHGHWVSTVAKGLASCDDNPRPSSGPPEGRGGPPDGRGGPPEGRGGPPAGRGRGGG